jgi:hypothetical protein
VASLEETKKIALDIIDTQKSLQQLANGQAEAIKIEMNQMAEVLGSHRQAQPVVNSLSGASRAVEGAGNDCKKSADDIQKWVESNFGG